MDRSVVESIRNHNHHFFPLFEAVISDILGAIRARDIDKWIGENADALNASNYGHFFGLLQSYSRSELFLMMGRIFDTDDRHQVSIDRIISTIPEMHLFIRTQFEGFLKADCRASKNLSSLSEKDLLDCGREIILKCRRTSRNTESLGRILSVRHNEVAHRAEKLVSARPYWADIEENLVWARKFISTMGKCFFDYDVSKGLDLDSAARSTVISVERVAHNLHILTSKHWEEVERLSRVAQGQETR